MREAAFFSPEDRAAVERAVREIEQKTSGEIVPYVVAQSDSYEEALWRGSLGGALIASVVVAAAWSWLNPWTPLVPWILAPPVVGAFAGWTLAVWSPAVRRRLVSRAALFHRCQQRAEAAFLEREVFKTRERTGILIFLSLFERRVVLLADSGIHARVEARKWDTIVAGIVAGIRAGVAGAALVKAIGECGVLLESAGVSRRADDTDELPNRLDERKE